MDGLTLPITLVLGGLIALIAGGELLVRGAVRLAEAARISPLVIGLTVVAFGTSSPEFAVSIKAAFANQAAITVGNVIGSNIFNVLFILGLSALVAPLVVASQLIRWDVPLMICASVAMLVMGLDHQFGRLDGAILFAGLVGYICWAIVQSRRESLSVKAEFAREYAAATRSSSTRLLLDVGMILVGLLLLGFGAKWLVEGGVILARRLGMSEFMIGLTIVAVGTSLPEVVASVMATIRGERDIAVGNVVGSSLFNILGVLGLSAALSPDPIEVSSVALQFDIPVMLAAAVACLPIFFTGNVIARWEGALFLGYYVAYIAYLILAETNTVMSRTLGVIMVCFVLPLTVITLGLGVVRSRRS